MTEIRAEVLIGTTELRDDIPFFTNTLKMQLDMIFPADNPQIAVFSGHGLRVRVENGADVAPVTLRIHTEDPDNFADGKTQLTAPNGTKVEIHLLNPPLITPETSHEFFVRRLKDQAPWVVGRAGMQYRDLIPSRLGGSIIASHIRIPDSGPVPDMVHYHKVGFQLIFCISGWVDVLYEDQGDVIRLHAGDCFIQPPEIRHRVMYASENLEVIEIGVPAEHITEIDHDMDLPNGVINPDREWQGQKFVNSKAKDAVWEPFRIAGFESRDTTIAKNTKGVAGVQVVRPKSGTAPWTKHNTDILFSFVMSGELELESRDKRHALEAGDAFVIPPDTATRYNAASDDLEILEVSLPGVFQTNVE